jgi:Branched-chain amino acid aminotransferase/4-amino-4-deoxychorismate lyase
MKIILTSEGLANSASYFESDLNVEHSVYEVIRIIDGVALFLEDHFQRLLVSIDLQKIILPIGFQEFKAMLSELIHRNNQFEGNVKFSCYQVDKQVKWVCSFISHSYPAANDYQNGVKTDLLFAERKNPNAKVVQTSVREMANRAIAEKGLYEVLLVNKDKLITEGSRSNVFFVKGNRFYTAPIPMILEGITRRKVFECLHALGFAVVEEAISSDRICDFDAAFLTGTSPKVLPVNSVGKQVFSMRDEAVTKLMDKYNQLIQEYIRNEKSGAKGFAGL